MMKKTIFTLVSMIGLAAADTTAWETVYELTSEEGIAINRGTSGIKLESYAAQPLTLSNLSGCFIMKTDGNTSPAIGKVDITFSLTDASSATTLVTFAADSNSSGKSGWGVIVDGGSLYLGQMNVNISNTTSDMNNTDCRTSVGTVTTGTTYTLSVISTASTTGTLYPGRGSDNFIVSLSYGETTTTTTVAGFGLNGNALNRIYIGGSQSSGDTGSVGTITRFALSVPEPATATLSLLALAGLAARRRRQ
ncbi:MAG: PEP-CTERM sorting domain-containing protein [Akkermansia sp.]